MKTILIIILLSLSLHAEEMSVPTVHFATGAQDLIRQALSDPSLEVSNDEDGNTIIKKRTEKSQNPLDEKDANLTYNLQRMFYLGLAVGSTYLALPHRPDTEESAEDDSKSPNFGLEGGFRFPFKYAKRFMIGGSLHARNGLRAPGDAYPGREPESDGFINNSNGTESYKAIFAEYDAILLPNHDAKAVLSLGIYKGFVKSSPDVDEPYAYSYTEKGYTVRLRTHLTGNDKWDMTPFLAFRYSNRKTHAIYGGFMFNFGERMKSRRKIEK